MAIGSAPPYAALIKDYARIESVRPVERRKDEKSDDRGETSSARANPQHQAQKPQGQGLLVDLFA